MAQQRRAAQRSLNNEADTVNLRRERHTPERARELRPRVFSNALHSLEGARRLCNEPVGARALEADAAHSDHHLLNW